MKITTLAEFRDRHKGQTAYVVGRGQTAYDYTDLAGVDGPVFFINDAVQLEKYLLKQDSYFFALDLQVAKAWMQQCLKSWLVLEHNYLRHEAYPTNKGIGWTRAMGKFEKDKDKLAKEEHLMTCWGTITPLLHFAWFTGCKAVKFIGCDGVSRPKGEEYDNRLSNESLTLGGGVYAQIKATQERVCMELGMPFVYLGARKELERPKVRFVSFATPKYEPMMMILANTAAGFGLETHFEAVKDRGGWRVNQAIKPEFMQWMQREYPAERLVWVDADAEFIQYPELFFTLPDDVDIAVHYRKGAELLSGTVYLGPTNNARRIVNNWVQWQKASPGTWDQKTLQQVLQGGDYNVHRLPPEYTFIHDTFRRDHPGLEPVIEHHQASRENR